MVATVLVVFMLFILMVAPGLQTKVDVLQSEAVVIHSEFCGKVIDVTDGDTIRIQPVGEHRIMKIRLAGIDAPELRQPYGRIAARKLERFIGGACVTIVPAGRDDYNRTVAHIYLGTRWINLEMVEAGCAWHYRYYSRDAELEKAEQAARQNGCGLWSERNPRPPWDFRRSSF